MGLFKRKHKADSDGFYETGISAESLQINHPTAITISDEDVILTKVDNEIVAFSSICPHAAADLDGGSLHRGRITCPDHGWKFDVRSGRCLWPEDEMCRLRTFEVKTVDAKVWVKIEAGV